MEMLFSTVASIFSLPGIVLQRDPGRVAASAAIAGELLRWSR